jgi:hypothetical protein
MTSIFNTYYAKNLERLSASFDSTRERSTAAVESGNAEVKPGQSIEGEGSREVREPFADILANLEKPKSHSVSAKGGESLHQSAPLLDTTAHTVLTNIPTSSNSNSIGLSPSRAAPQGQGAQQSYPYGPKFPTNAIQTLIHPSGTASESASLSRQSSKDHSNVSDNLTIGTGSGEKELVGVSLGRNALKPALQESLPLAGATAPGAPAAPKVVEYRREADYRLDGAPTTPTLAAVRRYPDRGLRKEALEPRVAGGRPDSVVQLGQPSKQIKEIVTTAGRYYGLDPNLGLAVAQVESSFNTDAVSNDGHSSKGLFQLLDKTGQRMHRHTGVEESYDPFDPAQNAYLGLAYLRHLHDIFSEETKLTSSIKTTPASSAEHVEKLAVAAYNAGEGSVARAQARAQAVGKDPADYHAIEPYLPASTQRYVQKVTQIREALAGIEPPTNNTKV